MNIKILKLLQVKLIHPKLVNLPRQVRQRRTHLAVGGRFRNARHGGGQLKEVLD